MRRAVSLALLLVAFASGSVRAADLSFTSNVDAGAGCYEVWTSLTEFARLQKLVPHLHGTANIARATKLGDALFYTIDKEDGSKNTGKMIVTSLEPAYHLQVMVQPDEGPWLRVQDFYLYSKPAMEVTSEKRSEKAEKPSKKKGEKDADFCHITYEEAYNELALKFKGYDSSAFVRDQREPYMQIILRRLKNISEGKDAGPSDEAKKLADVAKNFP